MSVAIISLLILIPAGIVVGLVLGRVFGAAVGRNENRPGNEEEGSAYTEGPPSKEEVAREGEAIKYVVPVIGALVAIPGILIGLFGITSGLGSGFVEYTVPTAFGGIALGVIGYALGARRLGGIAVILSGLVLIFGIAMSQGLVPGVQRTDHNLPANEKNSQGT